MPGFSSADTGDNIAPVPSPSLDDTVIIVPAYKEAQGIGRVLAEIRGTLNPVVLVINRPAQDGTEDSARREGAIVVEQAGRGKGNAVGIGLEYVRRYLPNTRYVGFVDADYTYPAGPMSSMRAILQGNPRVGMVVGQRENLKNNGAKSQAFAVGNRVLGRFHKVLNHVSMRDPLSGLRMVQVEVIRDWFPKAQGFDIECELNSYVHNDKRLGIAEIRVPYRERIGEKKLRLRDGFSIMARMIRISLRRIHAPMAPSPGAYTTTVPFQH